MPDALRGRRERTNLPYGFFQPTEEGVRDMARLLDVPTPRAERPLYVWPANEEFNHTNPDLNASQRRLGLKSPVLELLDCLKTRVCTTVTPKECKTIDKPGIEVRRNRSVIRILDSGDHN